MALRLADRGLWGGDMAAVLRAPADEVMLTIHYGNFKGDYEAQMMRIAKEDAK